MKLLVNALKLAFYSGIYRLLAIAGVMLMMLFAGGMLRWLVATVQWIVELVG